MTATEAAARPIRSLIPARLDRLSWSPFHTHTKPLTSAGEKTTADPEAQAA